MEQDRSSEAKCPSFQLRPVGIDVKPSIQILSLWLYIFKSVGRQKSYISKKHSRKDGGISQQNPFLNSFNNFEIDFPIYKAETSV